MLRDEHADVIRESVRAVARELMEAEISELIAPQRSRRSERAVTSAGAVRRRWILRGIVSEEMRRRLPKDGEGDTE